MTLGNWRKSRGITDGFLSVDRAVHTAKTIAEKPTVITVYRGDVAQAAQTVRLEPYGSPSGFMLIQMAGMRETSADLVIVGYKSHPTIADTDLLTGDVFTVDDQLYEVIQLFPAVPDRLLALAKVSDYGI